MYRSGRRSSRLGFGLKRNLRAGGACQSYRHLGVAFGELLLVGIYLRGFGMHGLVFSISEFLSLRDLGDIICICPYGALFPFFSFTSPSLSLSLSLLLRALLCLLLSYLAA